MNNQNAPFQLKEVEVLDSYMAYHEVGEGEPIVFLHGNPTCSYLWRNIIPHVKTQGRCIAPDLIGMGQSGKLSGSQYRFFDHRLYLDELLRKLGVSERVVLVLHDWGSGLGFDWANRHRDAIKGIAYMEAITAPAEVEPDDPGVKEFYNFFNSDEGEGKVLWDNTFIEDIFFKSLEHKLSESDKQVYLAPWSEPGENRRPMISWPREIPVNGHPEDMYKLVKDYQQWMEVNDIPKLFIRGEPGGIMVETDNRLAAARAWSNQTEIEVPGDKTSPHPGTNHYIQELCPNEIGEALAVWIRTLP
ncbi:haloalkane dehalogenase [Gammaproteobacteria bacterium]|nr:haloalkane dehalogenase [Gammaproteobacteria bacterium]